MIDSFSLNKKEKVILPGVLLYENILNFNEDQINSIIAAKDYINKNFDKYDSSKIKNTFFHALNKINKKEFAENVQKSILYYCAKYCDVYDEAIHTIQWQDNIFIDIQYAGESSFIFNTNKSFIDDNQLIKNTPFSRQIVVEVFINDNYRGGTIEWPYFNYLKMDIPKNGSILIYPSNYLFSKKHSTIIEGRKITLTTFLNGGKDFLSEENNLKEEDQNFLFSYMR